MMDSLRQCRPQVGLTTTRHGEMTSPNVIRRRHQTAQQHHSLPASLPRSRPGLGLPLITDEPCPSASLQMRGSQTPSGERQTTDAAGQRPITALNATGTT